MLLVYLFLVFTFGIAIGSFLGAYSYRWPRKKSVLKGRSFCPKCKKRISLYDNIPLLSYILLKGECRKCGKKISIRYPIIEASTAAIFSLIFYFFNLCDNSNYNFIKQSEVVCMLKQQIGFASLPYLLIIAGILIAIFIIDLENQVIPDELVFIALLITFTVLLLSSTDLLYIHLLSGFLSATFFLIINLITFGRGMGLGDVKLAIFIGMLFGWQNSIIWIFLSFIIGAVVGIILIIIKKARFGKPIPFGPFLVIAFFITLFFGSPIKIVLMPYF